MRQLNTTKYTDTRRWKCFCRYMLKTEPTAVKHNGGQGWMDGWGPEGLNPEGTGSGESGHAGHLTGRGDLLWRERWWNGSDVGRLQGDRGGGPHQDQEVRGATGTRDSIYPAGLILYC